MLEEWCKFTQQFYYYRESLAYTPCRLFEASRCCSGYMPRKCVASKRKKKTVAFSCFVWPMTDDKYFVKGLRKLDCWQQNDRNFKTSRSSGACPDLETEIQKTSKITEKLLAYRASQRNSLPN